MLNVKSLILNSRRGEGFTLLEVMISLALIGGLLITLLYTLNYHIGIAARHGTLTTATLLAKEKLDEIGKSPANTKGVFGEPYSEYSYETGVSETSTRGIAELLVVVRRDREEIMMSRLIRSSK